jgi:gas vesicle protein
MREKTGVLIGLVAGAAIGGAAGWLYLTEGGRRFRGRLEPLFQDLAEGAMRLRDTAQRAEQAASDSWRTLRDVSARGPGR